MKYIRNYEHCVSLSPKLFAAAFFLRLCLVYVYFVASFFDKHIGVLSLVTHFLVGFQTRTQHNTHASPKEKQTQSHFCVGFMSFWKESCWSNKLKTIAQAPCERSFFLISTLCFFCLFLLRLNNIFHLICNSISFSQSSSDANAPEP